MERSRNPLPPEVSQAWAEYEKLSFRKYSRVDWMSFLNLQQFPLSCPYQECWVGMLFGRLCPFRCRVCMAADRPGKAHLKSCLVTDARYRQIEEGRGNAAQVARALNDRAQEENYGLFSSNKLWFQHAPGVAVIRGDLLIDVANFFGDCDISVVYSVDQHNEPVMKRWLNGKGKDLFEGSGAARFRFFMRPTRQVRVQIDKFRPPQASDKIDFGHHGEGVLYDVKGAYGHAMNNLILFLGFSGRNEDGSRKVDEECSYWYYSELGFNRESKIGDPPVRMVRVPNEPVPDVYEIMVRLDLDRGKNRAEHFRDNFNETVKQWKYDPKTSLALQCDFNNVFAEASDDDEPEGPGLADSSEDSDVTNLSDMSGSTDESGVPTTRKERAAIGRRITAARAAHKRILAAEAARQEELATQAADEREVAEVQAARLRRWAESRATQKRRHAIQAARERAEARSVPETRPADAAEADEVSRTESGGTMDFGEEADNEDESSGGILSSRDIMRRFPRFPIRGGKL